MKLSKDSKVFAAFFVALLLLCGLTVGVIFHVRMNSELTDRVSDTYKVQGAISDVSSLIKDAETGARGYLLTGEDRFLKPYRLALLDLPAALAHARALTRENPHHQRTLDDLEHGINGRLSLLKQMIQHRQQSKAEISAALMEQGRLEMENIRLLLSEMSERESNLLEVHTHFLEEEEDRVQIFVTLLLMAALGLFAVVYGQIHALSRRQRETEALRKNEERFRTIADKVPSIIWMTDPAGKLLYVSRRWKEFCGTEPTDEKWPACIHPEDLPILEAAINRSVTQVGPWESPFRLRRHDGIFHWFWGHCVPLFNESGQLESYIGQSVDINDRRAAETALSEEKQKLAVTLRSIGDGVMTTDVEGRIELLNPAAEYLTGWKQAEAAGRPIREVFQIVHEYTRLPLEDPVQRVMRTGETVELANHTILISHDGKERIIADSAAPIRDERGQIIGTVLVFRDSTLKERQAEELLRSSKLESLGLLAGGIAHDFNNLLATILGNISMTERFPDDSTTSHRCLEEARKACLRARDLTQQLLTFSKGGAPVKKIASLKEVILESTQFALHGSSVKTEFDIAEDLAAVSIDVTQIGQVLHNIVLNALQAMSGSGTVRIHARNLPAEAGKMVRISISDSGAGIHPDHLTRIFDPYFTTKTEGTGLGLASAYSIVKKHEGHISVESKVGEGSTFHLDLPAHDPELREKATPAPNVSVVPGRGRLLALEDDRMLARMLKLMLGNLGYDVTLAHTGNQAIDLYREARESGRAFDGCILDLTLSGSMNGAETLSHLQKINSEIRALVCSGYSNDKVMADFREHGFCGVVVKPYTIEDISQAVHQMLTEHPGKKAAPSG